MWRRQHPRYDGTRESIGTDFFGAYGRCMHGRAVANVLGNPVLTPSYRHICLSVTSIGYVGCAVARGFVQKR
jgi:hypothetical protein